MASANWPYIHSARRVTHVKYGLGIDSTRPLQTWARRRRTQFPAVSLVLSRRRFWNRLSVVTLACCGLWTVATGDLGRLSKPLKADSSWSNPSPGKDPVKKNKRSAHSKARKESITYSSNPPSHVHPGQQKPPPQTKVVDDHAGPTHEKAVEDRSWNSFLTGLSDIQWATIPDKVTDFVVPEWIRLFPAFMTKFQNELSMAPGSLAEDIWREANDPECNPEIMWDAQVRVSDDICEEEKLFLHRRKRNTVKALARYLDIDEKDIHPDDVPVIAMCGSGGGLRALVAGSGSYIASREAGLFDCITYTAGVSGSCWLQSLYFTSPGHQDFSKVVNHLKNRLGVHLAYPPAAFSLISSAPTNKFLLTGLVEKLKGMPEADFGIVDIYGMLLAGRLLVPKTELGVDLDDLKISSQQRYFTQGQEPLPIYTAVRHEIPIHINTDSPAMTEAVKAAAKREAWFQWFEFTPYEFWCEEIGAGIPIWSLGRQFNGGKTVWRSNNLSLPETRLPMLLGIWGSAFCATLSHYYKEIQPVMKSLAGFGGIDQLISERDEDLIKVHPIDPATIPNFAFGMKGMLSQSCPESLYDATHLQLMDAGMSNNLPIYPLLRPGRQVDVIVAFDASADVRTDNWLKVVDGYARQRNIKGWPVGAGWPTEDEPTAQVIEELEGATAHTLKAAEHNLDEAKSDDNGVQHTGSPKSSPGRLGYCNVWVGSTAERIASEEPPPSKLVEEDWELMKADAGMAVIYFPFMANPKVEDVDPKTSDYLSTWNFVYTPAQVDKVVELARANFDEGKDQTKRTIRAVYERKKKMRLEREQDEKSWRRKRKMRLGIPRGRKLGEGDHGDHFS